MQLVWNKNLWPAIYIYIEKIKQHKHMDDFFYYFIIANRFPIFRA